jgi:hypothetical protein
MTLSRSRNAQSPRFETLLPHALADEEPVGVARRNPPLIPAGVREPKREVTHVARNSRPLARLAVNPSSIKLSAVPASKTPTQAPLSPCGRGAGGEGSGPPAGRALSAVLFSTDSGASGRSPAPPISQHGGLRRPATCDLTIRRTPRLELKLPSHLVGEGPGVRDPGAGAAPLSSVLYIAALPPSAPPISPTGTARCMRDASHQRGRPPVSKTPTQAPLAPCGRGAGGEGSGPRQSALVRRTVPR